MPPLIRRYIKTSFGFLITGLILGGYLTVGQFLLGTYPPRLVITAHVHLLLATALRAIAELLAGWSAAPVLRILVAVGGLGQLLGAALFVVNMWTRVRMPTIPSVK
jgi:hypothetical protein